MILCQLRKHLADEIRNFPGKPNAATQRYALTTAALARKILDYLNAENLTLPNGFRLDTGDLPLPNGFRPPASYKLRDVLDCIIHFRLLDQDDEFSRSFGLYSDEAIDHLYIRLADFEPMATDDAQYLLSCTNTLLNKVVVLDKPSERERREKKWAKIKDEIKDKPPQERKKKLKEDIEKEWAEWRIVVSTLTRYPPRACRESGESTATKTRCRRVEEILSLPDLSRILLWLLEDLAVQSSDRRPRDPPWC